MTIRDDEKLDNPVWHSLSETHKRFAVEYDHVKFYHPDYCPFGSFESPRNISNAISKYSTLTENFFIVGENPELPVLLKPENELICSQMIIHDKIDIDLGENIVRLTKDYADELYQLVNQVQPGYFKEKTFLVGDYYGILKENKLVAVTGERMKMNKYVEVSAVVTHPSHTGNGYAKQLVAHAVNNIIDQDKIPYLHVAETNAAAISLYKKLGFRTRRKLSFWKIGR